MGKKPVVKIESVVKPVSKRGNRRFSSGDACSFTGSTVIAGKPYAIICKKGIIETGEEILANHLQTMYEEIE